MSSGSQSVDTAEAGFGDHGLIMLVKASDGKLMLTTASLLCCEPVAAADGSLLDNDFCAQLWQMQELPHGKHGKPFFWCYAPYVCLRGSQQFCVVGAVLCNCWPVLKLVLVMMVLLPAFMAKAGPWPPIPAVAA
jgi:hypothetical protein